MSKNIPKNFCIKCKKCEKVYRTPIRLVEGMVPFSLVCPYSNCGNHNIYFSLPILPKIPREELEEETLYCEVKAIIEPSDDDDEDSVNTVNTSERHTLEGKNYRNKKNNSGQDFEIKSFGSIDSKINSIKEIALLAVREIGDLRNLLSFISSMIYEDIVRDCELINQYTEIDGEKYSEFIVNPFCAIQVPCKTKINLDNSRYLIYPSFINMQIGIDVKSIGSMSISIVNQYTMMVNNVNNHIRNYIGVPKKKMISVKGNRIYGNGLLELKNKIPGTANDIDSKDDNLVYRIINSSARRWLVKNGIKSFSDNPIDEESIDSNYKEIIPDEYIESFIKFISCGRLCIFGDNKKELHKLMYCFCLVLSGVKIILSKNLDLNKVVKDLKETNEDILDLFSIIKKRDSSIIQYNTLEKNPSVLISHCENLYIKYFFIDAFEIYDRKLRDVINSLLDFSNIRILMVCEEPFMDFDENDDICNLVYSICPNSIMADEYIFDKKTLNSNFDKTIRHSIKERIRELVNERT